MMSIVLKLCLVFAIVHSEKLQFKISGVNVPLENNQWTKVNPCMKVFYSTGTTDKEIRLNPKGSSSCSASSSQTFEFNYYPGLKQKLHVELYGNGQGPKNDSLVGGGYIDLDEYKKKGENSEVKFDSGTITINKE